MTWYRFRQGGDFVDFNSGEVFSSRLASSGWAPTAQGTLGLDYSLSPRAALTAQASYLWAKGTLGRDFSGFNKIDLSGLWTTVGLSMRF